jgi:type VI secretion system secreted protein VgrG
MSDILDIQFESSAIPAGGVEVIELDGRERIGSLFEFDVHLLCTGSTPLDEEAVLSAAGELVFSLGSTVIRRIFGAVSAIRSGLHTETGRDRYRLSFAPRAFRLGLAKTSEVFLEKSVPEIISDKLTRGALKLGEDFELRLLGSYSARDHLVQYNETDVAFISRLCEHVGISFFFEHTSGRDVMVFSDDNSGFRPIESQRHVKFNSRGAPTDVFSLEAVTRTIPSKYVVKDYNYRTPQVPLLAQLPVAQNGAGAVVEHGAHFKTPAEGEHIARVRSEELLATRRVLHGKSDVATLAHAGRVTIEEHPRIDAELLIVEVQHFAQQVPFGFGKGTERSYRNEFKAIDAKTAFRPERVTPKPRVHGAITGVVEAAEKNGSYADLDDQGRYHVRFQFDLGNAQHAAASHLIRMAQPHAGPGYGFHFPLRDGAEVLLTCIDGDPDRPIITGAVPNPQTPSTVGSSNGMRNVIRTGGGNEINIDDRKGLERIKLTTPHGNTLLQLGAPNDPNPGVTLKTSENAVMEAAGIAVLRSTADDVTVAADAGNVSIAAFGGDVDIAATGEVHSHAPTVSMLGGDALKGFAPLVELAAGANLNAAAPFIDVVGGSKIRAGAPEIEMNASATFKVGAGALIETVSGAMITISAGAVTVVHGGTSVAIDAGAAVTVTAPSVTINGSGVVNINGGGTTNIKGGVVNLN